MAHVLAHAGKVDGARAVAASAAEIDPAAEIVPKQEGYLSLLLGDPDRAIGLLRRYLQLGPQKRDYVAHDWWWEPLQGDPRFEELVDTTRSAIR